MIAVVAALWLGVVVVTLALCRAASFAPPAPSSEDAVSTNQAPAVAG